MTADHFTSSVAAYARAVWTHGRRAGLLADSLDIQTHQPTFWGDESLSNLACQQNFLRTLDALNALGLADYGAQANEWIGTALDKLRDPSSDLLYWGGHTSYDLIKDAPVVGNHELKCVYPHYAYLYGVDPAATQRFVEAFWHAHIWDWSTLLFNRHGEFTQWKEAWDAPFAGGPVPIVENTALSFINTGSDLILSGGLLHVLSGDEVPLRAAGALLSRYDQIRHPDTGLAGYQFNHRDPCRVRASFKSPYAERGDLNETSVLTSGVIKTRYGRVAVTLCNLSAALGAEKSAPFRQFVQRDLRCLAQHCYDAKTHCFYPALNDGTRLLPEYANEGVGYCPPQKLQPVPADGLLFLSYARAFRLLGDEALLDTAGDLARGMGWGDVRQPIDFSNGTSPASSDAWVNRGQNDACALFGLLDLYAATGERALLQSAESLGEQLLAQYQIGDLITSGATSGESSIDTALPLALLHLAAAVRGDGVDLPAFYPNNTYFDPKIVLRKREQR